VREGEPGTYIVTDLLESIEGPIAQLLRISPVPSIIINSVPISDLSVVTHKLDRPSEIAALLVLKELAGRLSSRFDAAFSCRCDFKPYQFRPLMKYFGDASKGLLIADETGLGKTIEAGYIIVEEIVRSGATRILVLCPSHLRHKWRAELFRRFGVSFSFVGGRRLLEILKSDAKSFFLIASQDCARSTEISDFENLECTSRIDLLVIDEIHRLIGREGDTLRRKLGISLAAISGGTIGVSATPVHLEIDDLRKVLDIVAPGRFGNSVFDIEIQVTAIVNRIQRILVREKWDEDSAASVRSAVGELESILSRLSPEEAAWIVQFIKRIRTASNLDESGSRLIVLNEAVDLTYLSKHLTRTRASDVGESRNRLVRSERIKLSNETRSTIQHGERVTVSEDSLYSQVDLLLKKSFSHVHRQQLSSSLPAMIGLLRLGSAGYDSWRARVREEDSHRQQKPGSTALSEDAKAESERLVNLYGLLRKDSKWQRLEDLLEELKKTGSCRKAIVFTHWIPTFGYLAERFSRSRDIPFFLGDSKLDYDDLEKVLARFEKHEGFAVLITTDVLREGVDIQAADCVINYDLPYNPQEIEQRIGRVDRVGQTSDTILCVNLLVEGSLDEAIYDRVLQRIGVFERYIGDMRPITEEMTLRLEDTNRIVDSEIARTSAQLEDRRRLMNLEPFLAVEDVLDEEVKAARKSRNSSLLPLRHWLISSFLDFTCPGCVSTWDQDTQTLSVQGLSSETKNAIASLAGIENRDSVERSLLNTFESGTVVFSFGNGDKAMPLTHPLFRIASEVLARRYEISPSNWPDETIRLSVDCPFPKPWNSMLSLGLVEYSYQGKFHRQRKLRFWGFGRESAGIALDESSLSDILETCVSRSRKVEMIQCSEMPDNRYLALTENDFRAWAELQAKRDLAIGVSQIHRSIQSLRYRIARIERETSSEPSGFGDIHQGIVQQLSLSLKGLESELLRLEDKDCLCELVDKAKRFVDLVVERSQ